LKSFGDNTAIARVDWWQPLKPGGVTSSELSADGSMVTATTLEEWVWQTLDGIAGGAGIKPVEEEEEEASSVEDSEHLVNMVSSITFSSS
jgi:hypothetical protein